MEVIQQTFPNESSAEKTISKEFKGSYSEETKMIGAVDDIYHPLPEENPKYEQMEEETRCARKKLCTACICCIVFMVVEVIAGFLSNSLALLTDASHLLSDVCSFSISIFAIWVSRIQGNSKMSFGYHRAEILGALISIILIWVLTGWLVYAAIGRLQSRIIVEGNIMFVTAIFGTLVNLFITYILKVHSHGIGHAHDHDHDHEHDHDHDQHVHEQNPKDSMFSWNRIKRMAGGRSSRAENPLLEVYSSEELPLGDQENALACENELCFPPMNPLTQSELPLEMRRTKLPDTMVKENVNLNLKAAYIHALGDLLQNVAVMVAAFIIWLRPSWSIADPICTLLFSIFVLFTTISILREAVNVLMEGTPIGVDLDQLSSDLNSIEGVCEVHDLHVWSLTVGKPALACHIVVDNAAVSDVLAATTSVCQMKYGILHTTIQTDFVCKTNACDTYAHQKCSL